MSLIDVSESTNERKCPDGFILSYIEYTKHQESPTDFHRWNAIFSIASALGRDCYLPRGYYNLYPNLYIFIVADSARLRKSTSAGIGVKLTKEALTSNISYFAQKITPEAFIKFLQDRNEETGRSDGVVYISEMATFLGKQKMDQSLIEILTDYYECPSYRSYTTISRGTEELKDVCINALMCTTPEWLKSSLPEDSVGGGFMSRVIMVNRTETERSNPTPEDTMDDPDILRARNNCLHDLEAIGKLKGKFRWSPDAKVLFQEWYEELREPENKHAFFDAYYGRKPDTLLKLSMILSANRGNTMIISTDDFQQAVYVLSEEEKYMINVVQYLGQSEDGKNAAHILKIINKNKNEGITHSDLMRRVSYKFNKWVLRNIIDTLEASGEIKKLTVGVGKGATKLYFGDKYKPKE